MVAPVELTTTLNTEPETAPAILVPVPVNVNVGDAPDPPFTVVPETVTKFPVVTLYPWVFKVAGELTVMPALAIIASLSVTELFATSDVMVLPADVNVVGDVIDVKTMFVGLASPVPKTTLDVKFKTRELAAESVPAKVLAEASTPATCTEPVSDTVPIAPASSNTAVSCGRG